NKLSQELKDLIFEVLANSGISVSDKKAVKFKRIGLKRGYNSSIYKLVTDDKRIFVIKITDHEEDPVLNILHNRELEFYEWLEGVQSEATSESTDLSQLLRFYGGSRCDSEPGVLIMNDLSSRVGIQPNYTIGYSPDLAFQIVKQIARYQSAYLCSDNELSIGKELIDYTSSCLRSIPKLDELTWMSEDEKRYLREWAEPEKLFALHTEIPEGFEGISPVLAHCDLWPGNMIFEQREEETSLLAILDWQTFKIGNPLLDISTVIGENMTAEDRREYTQPILSLYVDEMDKRKDGFKKPFQMTVEKARSNLSHSLRWPCIQTMFAVTRSRNDTKDEGQEMGRLSIRLRELIKD
ncbi:hypothetical protein PENTCL1PPCAC_2754, partial [Pristionchus entomophagus]